MNNKSKNIFSYLAKMPIVLLYLCFFTVQLLSFNSDNTNSQSTSWYNNDGIIKNKASANAGKADTNKQSNVNVRLNKRFQPEKAICHNIVIIKAPAFHLIEKSRRSYNSKFIPVASFAIHLLRGPPVVA